MERRIAKFVTQRARFFVTALLRMTTLLQIFVPTFKCRPASCKGRKVYFYLVFFSAYLTSTRFNSAFFKTGTLKREITETSTTHRLLPANRCFGRFHAIRGRLSQYENLELQKHAQRVYGQD